MRYLLVVEDGADNLGAHFPDVPGCVAVGDTLDEIVKLATEGLAMHLEAAPRQIQPLCCVKEKL